MTTMMSTRTTTEHPIHDTVEAMRWTPAPRWEGGVGAKTRFALYLVASMAAWVGIGMGIAAGIGGLTGLVG